MPFGGGWLTRCRSAALVAEGLEGGSGGAAGDVGQAHQFGHGGQGAGPVAVGLGGGAGALGRGLPSGRALLGVQPGRGVVQLRLGLGLYGRGCTRLARRHGIDVRVKRLSLRARGSGAVGEMTRLIGTAFDVILRAARAAGSGRPVVLVIDEADALAQSREAAQMHHEDRAGVNALIRGISQIASERLAILVIMCTNRADALDPAIRRRAAAEFDFARPDDAQRAAVLTSIFDGVGLSGRDVAGLVELTGPNGRGYGYTYSDLVDRVLAATCLAAYPDRPITADLIAEQVRANPPTRPFAERR